MSIRHLLACASTCAALATGGCAGLGNSSNSDLLKQLDSNFAACDRHLTFQGGGALLAPGGQVSGSVDCKGAATNASGSAAPPRSAP